MAANLDGLIVRRQAKETLAAVELGKGQTLEFTLADGNVRKVTLQDTFAEITETTLEKIMVEENAAVTNYRFTCTLEIEGEEHVLERQNSFQAIARFELRAPLVHYRKDEQPVIHIGLADAPVVEQTSGEILGILLADAVDDDDGHLYGGAFLQPGGQLIELHHFSFR